jgi:class 3 adenylate cyclase
MRGLNPESLYRELPVGDPGSVRRVGRALRSDERRGGPRHYRRDLLSRTAPIARSVRASAEVPICARSPSLRASFWRDILCRVGIHAGEVEFRGDAVTGFSVHIAARVCALADPDEVLATRTIKDVLVGSGFDFTDRGTHTLKGVPDSWQLFSVRRP